MNNNNNNNNDNMIIDNNDTNEIKDNNNKINILFRNYRPMDKYIRDNAKFFTHSSLISQVKGERIRLNNDEKIKETTPIERALRDIKKLDIIEKWDNEGKFYDDNDIDNELNNFNIEEELNNDNELINIKINKPTWDLERDIKTKMDILDKKTHDAIIFLLRQRIEQEQNDSSSSDDDDDDSDSDSDSDSNSNSDN